MAGVLGNLKTPRDWTKNRRMGQRQMGGRSGRASHTIKRRNCRLVSDGMSVKDSEVSV